MGASSTSGPFIYGIFCIVAVALVARISLAVYRLRGRQTARQRYGDRSPGRWAKWMTSGAAGLLLIAAWTWLGISTAKAAHHWRADGMAVRDQKMLPLDLHITRAIPEQTYTVIAKFRIHGRQYTSSSLQMRFGNGRPAYRLLLFYDPRNPARNAWIRLQSDGHARDRTMTRATGWMLLTMLLLEWLQTALVHRRAVPQHAANSE